MNENIHILPGVPLLFTSLLDHLRLKLLEDKKIDPANQKIHRILISTPLQESNVAPFLTELQSRVDAKGIKVGSYPRWGKNRNTITLVGRDKDYLESLVEEVTKKVGGLRVEVEGEDDVELKAEKLEEARDAIEKEVASDNGEKTS